MSTSNVISYLTDDPRPDLDLPDGEIDCARVVSWRIMGILNDRPSEW
jgi:hypothetical protein